MSGIEIRIDDEDNGGEVWLEITGGAVRETEDGYVTFTILDFDATNLLSDILKHRRPGVYQFGPLDVNG